jgi:hypothetical protein
LFCDHLPSLQPLEILRVVHRALVFIKDVHHFSVDASHVAGGGVKGEKVAHHLHVIAHQVEAVQDLMSAILRYYTNVFRLKKNG